MFLVSLVYTYSLNYNLPLFRIINKIKTIITIIQHILVKQNIPTYIIFVKKCTVYLVIVTYLCKILYYIRIILLGT